MRCLLTATLNVFAAGSAWAQAAEIPAKFADPGKAAALPSSAVSSMGQVTVALVIVLAILFVAAWGMRRFKLFNRAGQGALEVVQGINLGPKERAVLIKIDNRRLLLGVAPGCVNLLAELAADESVDSTAPTATDSTSANPNTPDFKTLLKRSMGLS